MTALAPLPAGRPQRLVYFGTPVMAVPALESLVAHGFEVALVVTRADKRRSRGGELTPSPLKAAAQRLGLPVSHRIDDVLDVGVDLGIVVAFGRLIGEHVLAAVPMVNLHFSLLPRWRGAAPVERAIMAGDESTGVCLMQLEAGLDTGPLIACVEVPIGAQQTAADLRRVLVDVGSHLLVASLEAGLADPKEQAGEATYAAKVDPGELEIDWGRPATEIARLVRVGGAWSWFRGKRLKILETELVTAAGPAGSFIDAVTVGCWTDALHLYRVQPEGKPAMAAAAWANGAHPMIGERLGDDARNDVGGGSRQ